MKIVVASDSYKGSLSSVDVSLAIKEGIHAINKDIEVVTLALGDGGEGTVEAIMYNIQGEMINVNSFNALNQPIQCQYGLFNKQAIMEMASASGLPLILKKDVLHANTYGTGLLIKDALDRGCQHIYIGIGGSATNDGGIGMADALGIHFYDHQHQRLEAIPMNLPLIDYIDFTHRDVRLDHCQITVMCDVTNPLCGPTGASVIYGPQKGATKEDIEFLDQGLQHLSHILFQQTGSDYKNHPGAGGAGGLGFGLMAFCNAKLQSGIDTVLEIIDFDKHLQGTDLVITGEGRIDNQSIYGKVPVGVAKKAMQKKIPTVAVVGCIGQNIDDVYDYIMTIESCVDHPCDLQEALDNASINVKNATIRLMKAILCGMNLNENNHY